MTNLNRTQLRDIIENLNGILKNPIHPKRSNADNFEMIQAKLNRLHYNGDYSYNNILSYIQGIRAGISAARNEINNLMNLPLSNTPPSQRSHDERQKRYDEWKNQEVYEERHPTEDIEEVNDTYKHSFKVPEVYDEHIANEDIEETNDELNIRKLIEIKQNPKIELNDIANEYDLFHKYHLSNSDMTMTYNEFKRINTPEFQNEHIKDIMDELYKSPFNWKINFEMLSNESRIKLFPLLKQFFDEYITQANIVDKYKLYFNVNGHWRT